MAMVGHHPQRAQHATHRPRPKAWHMSSRGLRSYVERVLEDLNRQFGWDDPDAIFTVVRSNGFTRDSSPDRFPPLTELWAHTN